MSAVTNNDASLAASAAAPGGVPPDSSHFSDRTLEHLYRTHSATQRRSGLQCLLWYAILFDLYALAITVPLGGQQWATGDYVTPMIVSGVCLVLAVLTLIWCRAGITTCPGLWQAVPHGVWLLATAQLLLHLFLRPASYPQSTGAPTALVTSRDSLGWALLLVYLIYVALPLRLRYCVMLSMGTCASYIVALVGLAKPDERDVLRQHLANCVLLIAANFLGLMSYHLEDAQQRRAFLETRQSLQVKLVIEEQSAEQERLLLSVLPEHVAVKMRQDLGSTDSQFKKIYMSRHENVSILYADIVGFTAISSTYSAQDLVKILNELFARFDRLAEKYQQLRIKILGDCYYCISGAPVERPDHAVLCVHMGLSMVKAIKYVQQTTNSPVDMRVGIHTGAVLAGVLGQRQWQFDVYSKDVELANKMESSGMAGRVHISHQTLGFLDGEFEVEPAHGERREEALRMAGIKTYFIVKVLKPYSTPLPELRNGCSAPIDDEENTVNGLHEDTIDGESKCASPVADEVCMDMGTMEGGRAREDTDDFKNRLRKELVSRDGHRELQKRTSRLSLRFTDSPTEHAYTRHRAPLSSLPVLGHPLVALATATALAIVLPLTPDTIITEGLDSAEYDGMRLMVTAAAILVLAALALVSAAEAVPKAFPRCLTFSSRAMNDSIYVRRITAVTAILILTVINTISMTACHSSYSDTTITSNCTLNALAMDAMMSLSYSPLSLPCRHPSYFTRGAVLCLVAAAILPQLSHLSKAALMCAVTATHCALNMWLLSRRLDCEDRLAAGNTAADWMYSMVPSRLTLCYMLIAVTIALSYLARHMERVSRVLFLWKTEVSEQRERASDMRRRNEALVYNVLPPHVAAHFMGKQRRTGTSQHAQLPAHDELYSQSYADVGVLFASMPNFSDFYSEETVNNQGLECLRFLNEVISDFDALLEQPQFKDIIKIKTIGSTYMAASGLKPTDDAQSPTAQSNTSVTTRWAHLALLVEFALELKRALQCINEQSFNHFVLKMGVNHGPITAGVIGARKPHYDIWGNTVNVASRMESTGKAGAIQVTEETCNILQQFGYTFEQRGLVAVKGKGQLMTYYLQGKTPQHKNTTGAIASPLMGITTMETLQEEDEQGHHCDSDDVTAASGGFDAASPGSVRLRPCSVVVSDAICDDLQQETRRLVDSKDHETGAENKALLQDNDDDEDDE